MPYKSVTQSGDTIYGRKTVNSIIVLAVKEIDGVAGLYGRGYRADFNGFNVDVDIYINVFDGIKCAEIAFKIQENIKKNVESMTAFSVGVVNVNVFGVVTKEKTPDITEQGAGE